MKAIDLGYGCENSMPNKGKIVIYTEHNGEIFYCTCRPHFCDQGGNSYFYEFFISFFFFFFVLSSLKFFAIFSAFYLPIT
jgi:hypothetical protein